MNPRRNALVVVFVAVSAAVGFACASDMEASKYAGAPGDGGATSSSSGGIGLGDGGATGAASGVVVVHAAALPPFRLCFENYATLRPQPDERVLPQSNVVGLEMGRLARIGALARAPGKVRLIGLPSNDGPDKSCGEIFRSSTLRPGRDYEELGEIQEPFGMSATTVLAVTGCGSDNWVSADAVSTNVCGADYDKRTGNLKLMRFVLPSTRQTAPSELPVELYDLSPNLLAEAPAGHHVEFSFGDLDASPAAPLAQPIPAPFADAGASAVLDLALGTESVYGTHGFRIAYRPDDAGADAGELITFDETLAEIQAQSRPESNPTTYFLSPSNYAVLVLGDPRVRRRLPDGGANPGFDLRRGLHLLALPVREDGDAGNLGGIGPATR